MKKNYKAITVLVVLFLCCTLASCSLLTPAEEHQHTYTYSYDAGNHWQVCESCHEALPKEAHTFTDTVTSSTCTTKGETKHTCTVCGYTYTDEIDLAQHDYKLVTTVQPTCANQGYDLNKCNTCGAEIQTNFTDALPHFYTSAVTKEPTCTADGVRTFTCTSCGDTYTETITKLAHDYKTTVVAPTCTAQGYTLHKCTQCQDEYKDTYTPVISHNYTLKTTVQPTCTAQGYDVVKCTACGDEQKTNYTAKLTHSYKLDSLVEATCSATGTKVEKCEHCGDVKTTVLEKIAHTMKTVSTTPTCTENGHIKVYCEKCDYVETDSVIPTFGHSYEQVTLVEPTCTTDGYKIEKCDRCQGEKRTELTKLGHDYQTTVVAPTCTAQGYTLHKCTRCDSEYKDTYTDALTHSYTSAVTKEATCTVDGVRTFTCTRCSDTYTESITKLGHDYKTTVVEPTCASQGYTLHKCSRCDSEYKDNYVDATGDGHKIQYVEKVEPTCDNAGTIAHFRCINCGKTYADINGNTEISQLTISKLNHDISKVFASQESCTEKGNIACFKCNTCGAFFSDQAGKQPLTESQVYKQATGHNYTDISYDLIKSTEEIVESGKIVLVAYTGGKYYAITTSNSAVEVSVNNGKITSLPSNVQLLEINSSDSTGYYSLFAESGLGTNKYICSVNSGTYTTNDAGNTLNSARWKITFDTNGLATMTTDKSTNKLPNLSFYVTNKKLSCCSAYNSTYVNFYIFARKTNDVNEVRMADGTVGAYYTCKDCHNTYEYGTNKQIAVSYKYEVIGKTDKIYTNDQVLLVNNYYNYSTKEDVQYEKYNIYPRIVNNAIEDDAHVQVFQIKRGLTQSTFRFNYLNTNLFIYVKDASSKFTLVRTSYLYTSQLHGQFAYTPYDNVKGQLVSTTSRTCNTMIGMEAGFYMESESNSPYGYSSRYMSIYRKEYTFTDANGTYVVQVNATCESDGTLAHYVADDGTLYDTSFVKVNADELVISALGHNYTTVNQVIGTDYHEIVCANNPSHKLIEKCIYNSEGICTVCGNTKDTTHSHEYNMKLLTANALVNAKTCHTYAVYKYSCSCGALGTGTFEDVLGGYAPHDSITLNQQNATCTEDGYGYMTYCAVCGLIEDVQVLPALGHNLDNGDFVFNSMDDKNDVSGVWTYHCQTCSATITKNGDITTRPGSGDYAYRKILEGKYQNGEDFAFFVNDQYVKLNGYDFVSGAVNIYKQMFNICEDMLDDDTDYTVTYSSGTDATTSLGYVNLPYITSNVKFVSADLVAAGVDYKAWGSFARGIVEWFKSDHPEYFFLNADSWSNSRTYNSTTETPRVAMTMYGTFAKNEVRKYYQNELEKIYKEYDGKYLDIADERVRARTIYDKVIEMIEYTYGPSTDSAKCGTAKAPNTICPMVDGKGVCESYALSFCLLARMNGLEAEEMGSATHAWTYTKINGSWYIIDPTWGDDNAEVTKSTVKWFCHNVYNPDSSHTVKDRWMPFDPIGTKQLSY